MSKKESVGTWDELKPVACAYTQRIEDVDREGDLALCGDFEKQGILLE